MSSRSAEWQGWDVPRDDRLSTYRRYIHECHWYETFEAWLDRMLGDPMANGLQPALIRTAVQERRRHAHTIDTTP